MNDGWKLVTMAGLKAEWEHLRLTLPESADPRRTVIKFAERWGADEFTEFMAPRVAAAQAGRSDG